MHRMLYMRYDEHVIHRSELKKKSVKFKHQIYAQYQNNSRTARTCRTRSVGVEYFFFFLLSFFSFNYSIACVNTYITVFLFATILISLKIGYYFRIHQISVFVWICHHSWWILYLPLFASLFIVLVAEGGKKIYYESLSALSISKRSHRLLPLSTAPTSR